MDLAQAMYCFYRYLAAPQCAHPHVSFYRKAGYCPDCGYKIKLLWTFVRCRKCGAKRIPRQQIDGSVVPLQKYCIHCGTTDYCLVKKEKIEAHDLLYCVAGKEIDYSAESGEEDVFLRSNHPSPFHLKPEHIKPEIVEGYVVRKVELG